MARTINIGFIGLGQRGHGLLYNVLNNFGDINVVAVCDSYLDRAEDGAKEVLEKRNTKAAIYTDYRELLKDENVELVIISAAWEAHVPLAVASMKAGKITALEVGGAYGVDDCWELVKTYEETKTPFMFLENCCWGKKELLATALTRKGALGEVVYCHGSYCHDLREEIAYGVKNRHYRLRNYLMRNCDNYPTHELGPIAKLLNINRGNAMLTLTSMASKARGLSAYVKTREDLTELHDKHFAQGDVVETHITCADGSLISLKLDTTLPRAYSREFAVSGTKGMYSELGNMVLLEGEFNHEKEVDEYYGNAKDYEKKYLPRIWREITEEEIKAGHGGMDTLMLKALFEAIREGKEMPLDVYDAAAWMVITCLSQESVAMGGAPVAIPDFTRGQWVMRESRDVVDFEE